MKKIILCFFFIISMGLLMSYITINSYVIRSGVELEKNALRSDVELLAQRITLNLSDKTMLVKQMANYYGFINFMATLPSRETIQRHPGYEDIMATLDHIKINNDKDIDLVFFVSQSGNAIIKHDGNPVPPDWNLEKRQWYLDTIAKGSTFISDPYPDAYTNNMVITVAEPVMLEGKLIGATGIDVTITTLIKMVGTHPMGGNGYLVLVDPKGTILAHPQAEFVLQPLSTFSPLLMETLLRNQAEVTEYIANGETQFVTSVPIPLGGWSLLAIQPKAEVLKKTDTMQTVILTVFLAVFILLSIVTVILLLTMENLRKTQNQMITSEKMASLGKLVAGIAHELNTPLGVALTAVSFLKDITVALTEDFSKGNLKKMDLTNYLTECQESASIILANVLNASRLVKSFKQVSADQSSDIRRCFKVKEYLDEILLTLLPLLKKTKHSILITCDEELEFYGSPGNFSLIVTNLIMNSLIHAYQPENKGNITIELKKIFDKNILIYTDDGKGMDATTKSKIFDPFFTTQSGQGGTGLGLYLVYNVVTLQLGGTVECITDLGKGTKFIIEIPKKSDDEKKTSYL